MRQTHSSVLMRVRGLKAGLADLAQHEVPEYRDALRVPQLLRVDEMGLYRGTGDLRQHLRQIARRRNHEIGQGGEAETGNRRAVDAVDVVHRQNRPPPPLRAGAQVERSEEHTSELQSLMRISYAVVCLKTKKLRT